MKRALALALLLCAPHAVAQPAHRKGARIVWVRGIGAERCVGTMALEEDVKSRLGYDPFALPGDLVIEGAVVTDASSFRAEILVRDADGKVLGTRRLAGRDCRSLGDAVAVAMTVAIDPDSAGVRTSVVEAPPAPPPEPPRPVLVEERALPGRATISGNAAVGLLPEIAPGASLRVRAGLGPAWEIGLGAHFWPEMRKGGIGFGLASASLDLCVAPLSGARLLRWCGAIHGGVFEVFVHAAELAPVEVGMFPWVGAETGPAVSVPLGKTFRLDASIAAIVPVTRRQALVRGQAEAVWEQSPVGGRAEIGLGARF